MSSRFRNGSEELLTVALTLPLAPDLKRTLPSDLTDTLLTTWIISWDAERLRHGLRGVWDAPIFFPYHTPSPSPKRCSVSRFSSRRCSDHRRSGADL